MKAMRQVKYAEVAALLAIAVILAATLIPEVQRRLERSRRTAALSPWLEPAFASAVRKEIKVGMTARLAAAVLQTVHRRQVPLSIGIGVREGKRPGIDDGYFAYLLSDATYLEIWYFDGRVTSIATGPKGKGYPGKYEWDKVARAHARVDLAE